MFDYIGVGPELPKQRPHPDMIFDMMKKVGVEEISGVIKVGDTAADIQEGKNAGARTVAILAGTQPEGLLRGENPDFIIKTLSELRAII